MRRDEFPIIDKHVQNEITAVLNKIRAEISEYKDDKIIHAEQNGMIDIMLGIIDKYRGEQE